MRAKIIKWILWLTASIVLMFVALLFITPALLNSDFIRTKIITLVAEEIGAELEYQNVMLVFTPLPTFQVEQIKFDFPDIIDIHADRIKLSPNFVKLLSGGGLVDSLRLEKPEVRLDLPHILAPSPDPITEAELWIILSQIIKPLISYTPDLKIVLTDGSFDLADKTDAPFFVHGIEAELVLNAEQETLNVELTGQFTNLAFEVNDATTQLNVQKLSASTLLHPDLINLRLNNLSLKQAELDFNGELTVAKTNPKFKLSLASQVPDLIKIFPFLRPLLAEVEGSDQAFDSILGGSLKNISMQSEADDILGLFDYNVMRIDARLEEGEFFLSRLSHKVDNVSARLRIADRRIELSDAHLETGQSYANIEKIAVYRKNKQAPFMLDIDNTRIHFNLAALHKNLYGFPAIKDQLDEIASVSGALDINMIKLKGPLAEVADWKFKATGEITDTVIATPRFPAPITVQSGSYSADERSVVLKEIHLKGLDADLKVSGHIKGKIPVPAQIEVSVTGEVGKNFNHWFRDTVGLADPYTINSPISIKNVSLLWKGGKNVVAKGDFKPSGGPTISGDISYTPSKTLQVKLSLSDQMSHANIAVLIEENNSDVSFSGNLKKETINNIFVKEQLSSGRIEGEFSLELARDNGIQITTSGQLQGENLLLPINFKEPITISAFSVTGRDQTLGINHLALGYGEERADIKGSIGSVAGNYHLDLDVHTGPLDLLEMIKKYEEMRGEHPERAPDAEPGLIADIDAEPQDLPFSGRVNLDVDALSLKHLSIDPLRAEIQIEPQLISAQLVEANLCDIDLLASANISPGIIELDFPISARDQDLAKWSICMTGERSKVTGTYDLKGGFFSTRGAPEELIEAAQGKISLVARDGAIEQSPLVSQLLSVVNLTEIYKTDYRTLDKSKLGYETLEIEGILAQGRMEVPKIHFDGTTLEIIGQGHADLSPPTVTIELLIAPLKTVDSIVKWIPGVNYLLAGNLISIPVSIKGPVADPRINVIPISSVGQGLLGLTERILKIPVKIVTPLLGEGKENQEHQPEKP